jgi:hypothetical protein
MLAALGLGNDAGEGFRPKQVAAHIVVAFLRQ